MLGNHGLGNDLEIMSALEIAKAAHANQKRSPGGYPYLEDHVYPVTANVLSRYVGAKNLKLLAIVALLHDVLEDSDMSPEYLVDKVGITPVNIVRTITKNKYENEEGISQEEKYIRNKQYLSRIHGNLEAIIIKLEDRLQNIQCFDADRIAMRPEKAARYVRETHDLFLPLAKTNGLAINYKALLCAEVERVTRLLRERENNTQ